MCIPTIRELPYMTDFLKIAKSIVVHFAHICAYGVETVNNKLTYYLLERKAVRKPATLREGKKPTQEQHN